MSKVLDIFLSQPELWTDPPIYDLLQLFKKIIYKYLRHEETKFTRPLTKRGTIEDLWVIRWKGYHDDIHHKPVIAKLNLINKLYYNNKINQRTILLLKRLYLYILNHDEEWFTKILDRYMDKYTKYPEDRDYYRKLDNTDIDPKLRQRLMNCLGSYKKVYEHYINM